MRACEKVLQAEIHEIEVHTSGIDRQVQLAAVVQEKLQQVDDARWRLELGKRTIEIKQQVDRIIRAVVFAKDLVSAAAFTEPHAALAWAGVSLFLPILLNPTSQRDALLEVVDYVVTLSVRYVVVEDVYRKQKQVHASGCTTQHNIELQTSFETQVAKLYSQILSLQARIVCQLHKPTLTRYALDIMKKNNWPELLSDIRKQEKECQEHMWIINAIKLDAAFERHESSMEERFRSLENELEFGREQQRQQERSKEERACLSALDKTKYKDYKNHNPDQILGTCKWFLESEKFSNWRQSKQSDLLLVTADPGCGKSVLSKSLIDHELRSTDQSTTAYFFFKDDSPEQRNAVNALCALLHQICSTNPALLRLAVEAHQRNPSQLASSFSWLWDLFIAILEAPDSQEIVCVLDALDECEPESRELLIQHVNTFCSSQQHSRSQVKFLVTSRPYLFIDECFDKVAVRLSGENESESIKQEIDLVIKNRVAQIASRKKLDTETQVALSKKLLGVDNRTYLWLHLTLTSIEDAIGLSTPKRVENFIDLIPGSLNVAYESILSRSTNQMEARQILHIILAAIRPLHLGEMNMALNIRQHHKSIDDVDLYPPETFASYIRNLCGLFLNVYNDRIFLIHQTAREFLVARDNLDQNVATDTSESQFVS